MKYEAPEVTALTPAINAIQWGKIGNPPDSTLDAHDAVAAYEDWE